MSATQFPKYKDDAPTQYSNSDQDLEKGLIKSSEQDIPLPAETATAREVCEYLASILELKYNLRLPNAEYTASRWSIGTGHELRTFTPQLFREIFGGEVGWVLYKEVQIQVEAEKEEKKRIEEEKKPKMSKKSKVRIFQTICYAFLALFVTVAAVMEGGDGKGAALGFIALAALISIFIAAMITFDPKAETGVEQAERKLKDSYKSTCVCKV